MDWNRLRYSVWAPLYDRLVAAFPSFDTARRESIARLRLQPGERLLIVGAGTGLDLPHVPASVRVTAIDVTPAMLERLRARAAHLQMRVDTHVMDARTLAFDSESFDAVVLHLILAVMPQPELGLREAERVTRPGGRVAVFDKFLRHGERPSLVRRAVNLIARPLFSDMNRRFEPLLAGTSLVVARDEPSSFHAAYRQLTLLKRA